MKYLDPKNDLTFKKIFGEHPSIMKSFLNSILPLEKEQYIVDLIYSDPALLPILPELKHSIVDVRCTDNFNRIFIVEMQMYWTSSFASRMLFNSSKAYVKQIDKGHKYSELHPVYGLSLVDDIFLKEEKDKDNYYHHYKLAHQEIPDEYIPGIELIFIELPKFKASTFSEKKLRNLWLRFLTEVDEQTTHVSREFYTEKEIEKALECLQESAFTKKELAYYEKYWDNIRVERTSLQDYYDKGLKKSDDKLKEAIAKEKGSGIGLSLSRQIMHLHRGTISVRSDPELKTVFTLKF
jgi:predicted transposase/invertase (TIGR01784 family)